jgi:hypothetical protein
MSEYKTINGHAVKTHEWRNYRIPSHARRLCASLDRENPAVERVDYSSQIVSVWMDDDHRQESFDIPDGWKVIRAGVYGGGVCIDLKPEDDR